MEGKTVEVIVTFNEAVEVKTNGGTPTIGINLDTSRSREAPYARGTDTHEMVFAYTIANGDGNTNRIAVNPNSIKRNGAEVHSAETKVEAVLDHDGTVVETTPILPPPAQGPSARFANMPAHHDGIAVRVPLALQHRDTGAQLPNRAGRPARGRRRLGECSRATDTGGATRDGVSA